MNDEPDPVAPPDSWWWQCLVDDLAAVAQRGPGEGRRHLNPHAFANRTDVRLAGLTVERDVAKVTDWATLARGGRAGGSRAGHPA